LKVCTSFSSENLEIDHGAVDENSHCICSNMLNFLWRVSGRASCSLALTKPPDGTVERDCRVAGFCVGN
jgi:hypothetical protein